MVSLALMAGVTWQLGRVAVSRPVPALISAAALALLFWTRINPAWLVIGRRAIGLVSQLLSG